MRPLKCILLIDDSDADIFLHRRVVQRLGCAETIVTASHGQAALDLLSRSKDGVFLQPELILPAAKLGV